MYSILRGTYVRDNALCLVEPEGSVYRELFKPGETVNTQPYQQQLMDLNRVLLENGQNIERGNTKSFFFMTMLHHMQQNCFVTHQKHSCGKFYPVRVTHQIGLLPITT